MNAPRRDYASLILPIAGIFLCAVALGFLVATEEPRNVPSVFSFLAFFAGVALWTAGTIVRAVRQGFRELSGALREGGTSTEGTG